MALITLLDAQLAFGHVALLDHAGFSLETAERVGMIGRNGAGKSTLLRVLGGVYEPTAGVVELSGSMVGLFELGGIGNPYLTGIDYAVRYLSIMGASKRQIPDLQDEAFFFNNTP